MSQFDYSRVLSGLMTPEGVSALGNIRERKGKPSLLSSTHPDHFAGLVEVAKIQSTGASNRIENISTSDKRLRELILEKAEPRNRDEREVAGYRYVLDLIHESHDDIQITPGVILQPHRDLYRYSGDSLLVSLVFVFDFVSIHPFNDGNGRMSRLLTLLFLYRSSYDVGKYVSIEKEIEHTKETHYEALAASSQGWREGKND